MTFLNNETVTLPAHTVVFTPDDFLEDVYEDHSNSKIVKYGFAEELRSHGISCATGRQIVLDTDDHGNTDGYYEHHLEIRSNGCVSCAEPAETDILYSGDTLVIFGYGQYTIIRGK